MTSRGRWIRGVVALVVVAAGCAGRTTAVGRAVPTTAHRTSPRSTTTSSPVVEEGAARRLPGMPPVVDPSNIYSQATAGKMSPAVAGDPNLVYVPDNDDGDVWVIDQATYAVIGKYHVGKLLQHVVPGHDLTTLYANSSGTNQLIPFDPKTGTPGTPITVGAPYNLYFSPDGRFGIVMAERLNKIEFYRLPSWTPADTIDVPCPPTGPEHVGGINHADWSADGRYFIATCEFSGQLIKVDTETHKVLGVLTLAKGDMPQDCRLGPDGTTFFVADMMAGGLHVIDGASFTETGFITTGDGAHGIYPSRDGTELYVSNRGHSGMHRPGGQTISVVDPAARKVVATWTIPGGGSPDMGGVSADGTKLWLSGRYDDVVYVFDTTTGHLIRKIPVGRGPHGLAVFPQPGRYSLGHTGNYR